MLYPLSYEGGVWAESSADVWRGFALPILGGHVALLASAEALLI